MSNVFFENSKDVANKFIQSIVFLDDRAYQKNNVNGQNNVHDLDAHEISKFFAKEKKICAVYDPETVLDIEDFKSIAEKADVVILDWFININIEPQEQENAEDDAEEDDVRGIYTLDIILNLIKENDAESLKIIVVYTGETNLLEIVESITALDNKIQIYADDVCKVSIGNITILVRAKSNNQEGEDNRFDHLQGLKSMVLKYRELPDFILMEFTKKTSGLLSNFALLSLATLRHNTSKILGLYNKELDHAYLEHKASIPNEEDAENLIIEVFKDSIGDLLYYKQLHKKIGKKEVSQWIDNRLKNEQMSFKKKNGILHNPDSTFPRNKQLLISLIYSEEKDVQKKFIEVFTPLATKGKAEEFYGYLKLNNIELFINNAQQPDKDRIIAAFAKLTHHKNAFLPRGIKPILSLGTVIKSDKTGKYFICIQQKCDSVRISNEETRKFLFIPLVKVDGDKFNFITQDHVKLKLETKSYSLRTLKFNSTKDGFVESRKYKEKFYFKQYYKTKKDEKFEWVLDLKDLHAQRIVTDYAATLSRVGLDESEWLRKSAIN